nr:hypothetical protein [uncultured bacterium]
MIGRRNERSSQERQKNCQETKSQQLGRNLSVGITASLYSPQPCVAKIHQRLQSKDCCYSSKSEPFPTKDCEEHTYKKLYDRNRCRLSHGPRDRQKDLKKACKRGGDQCNGKPHVGHQAGKVMVGRNQLNNHGVHGQNNGSSTEGAAQAHPPDSKMLLKKSLPLS